MATDLTLRIDAGASFSVELDVGTDYNGRTVRASWRAFFGGPALATFTTTPVALGVTTLTLTATQTDIPAPPWALPTEREIRYGVWDAELVDGSAVHRSHQGHVIYSRAATT